MGILGRQQGSHKGEKVIQNLSVNSGGSLGNREMCVSKVPHLSSHTFALNGVSIMFPENAAKIQQECSEITN